MKRKYFLLFVALTFLMVILGSTFHFAVAQEPEFNHFDQCTVEAIPPNPTFYKGVPGQFSVIITVDKLETVRVRVPPPEYKIGEKDEVKVPTWTGGLFGQSVTTYVEMPTRYDADTIALETYLMQSMRGPSSSHFVGFVDRSLVLEIYHLNGTLLTRQDLIEGDIDGLYETNYVFPDDVPVGQYSFSVKLSDVVLRIYLNPLSESVAIPTYYNHIYVGEATGTVYLNPIPEA